MPFFSSFYDQPFGSLTRGHNLPPPPAGRVRPNTSAGRGLTVVSVCCMLHWHQLAAAAKAVSAAHLSTSTAAMRGRRQPSSLPCSPQAQCRAILREPVQSEQGSAQHFRFVSARRVRERLNVSGLFFNNSNRFIASDTRFSNQNKTK